MRPFLGAVQFLTVIPVSAGTASVGASALFFPLIGALLGAVAGCLFAAAQRLFSPQIAGVLTVLFLIVVTGALHEDGLADVADALPAGRSRERMLQILKDSRIGTFGGLALMASLLVRAVSIPAGHLPPVAGLAIALAFSRSAIVALAEITPAVGSGLGAEFHGTLPRRAAVLCLLQPTLLSLAVSWRYTLLLLPATLLVIFAARTWFMRRLGGTNGDCLGATSQVVESLALLLLACPLST